MLAPGDASGLGAVVVDQIGDQTDELERVFVAGWLLIPSVALIALRVVYERRGLV